jgi:hypothetical protein
MVDGTRDSKDTPISVSICFADEDITMLFAELIRAQGVKTSVVESLESISGETRVITEPRFLKALPAEYRSTCLVVGNKESLKGLDVLSLSRPLTEEKVEAALAAFLGA